MSHRFTVYSSQFTVHSLQFTVHSLQFTVVAHSSFWSLLPIAGILLHCVVCRP